MEMDPKQEACFKESGYCIRFVHPDYGMLIGHTVTAILSDKSIVNLRVIGIQSQGPNLDFYILIDEKNVIDGTIALSHLPKR